jgi:hypothetical protein
MKRSMSGALIPRTEGSFLRVNKEIKEHDQDNNNKISDRKRLAPPIAGAVE